MYERNVQEILFVISKISAKNMIIKYIYHTIFDYQVNNYVIFSGFFRDRPQDQASPVPKKARIYMGKLQYVWGEGGGVHQQLESHKQTSYKIDCYLQNHKSRNMQGFSI